MVMTAPDPVLETLRRNAEQKLEFQVLRGSRYQRYYDGEAEIVALLNTDERQTFRKFLAESSCNWCELIVNAVAERLQVTGFRWGGDSDAAWAIWQASQLDADSELAQTDALVTGQSFMLVQPDPGSDTGVRITVESPYEATVLYAPGDRRKRIAGYKRFSGDAADYLLPPYYGEPAAGVTEVLITPEVIATWLSGEPDNPVILPNPTGIVGMVEIIPQPRTWGPPRSELTPAAPIQDRINTMIFNRLVGADYGAFRQIWASGVRMQQQVMTVTAEDGTTQEQVAYVAPYDVGANRLLVTENPNAKFGSFPEATLQGYLAGTEQDVNHLAAITQTPPHYLLGHIVNLSGDAIKAAETGLVAKVGRRALHIGEAYEDVISAAFAITGNDAAAAYEGAAIWRDFETRSQGQLVDALVKMRTLGVPLEELWRQYGATPADIEMWRTMRVAELAGPQLAPQPVPTTATGRTSAPGPELPVNE